MKDRIISLQKYYEVYQCIGAETISMKELQTRHMKLMKKATSESRLRGVRDGMAEMLIQTDDKIKLDYGVLRSVIEDLCKDFGTDAYVLFAGPAPAAKGRGGAEPEYRKIEDVKESPQVKQLKEQKAKLVARIKDLEEERVSCVNEICDSFVNTMDKNVFVPSTIMGFGEAFDEDIFWHKPEQMIGKEEMVALAGGETPSCYLEKSKKEYTVKNLWNGIVAKLIKSDFFKIRYRDEQLLADQKDDEVHSNRARAIEELLQSPISNQAKLSLYAGMHEYHGTELEDLLNFAGDKGLDAEYVIRLLERPAAYNNYENVRGYLRQACKASEAKMKRTAAMELIAGEWYVMAMYNGKPCKFQMVPVDEILELRKALVEHVPTKVLTQIDKILGTYRKAAFVDNNPEKEIVAKNVGFNPIDAAYYSDAVKRLHQFELPDGVNQDAGMNEDVNDDFQSEQEDEDGE